MFPPGLHSIIFISSHFKLSSFYHVTFLDYIPHVYDDYTTDTTYDAQNVTMVRLPFFSIFHAFSSKTLWDTAGQEDFDAIRFCFSTLYLFNCRLGRFHMIVLISSLLHSH